MNPAAVGVYGAVRRGLSIAGIFNLSDNAGHINDFNDARGP